MEKNRNTSSFSGFLNDYSRGNLTADKTMNDVVSLELSKLISNLDQFIKVVDQDNVKPLIEQVSLAKRYLEADSPSNVEKLFSFINFLDVIVTLEKATEDLLSPESTKKVQHIFNKIIFDFFTIVKKVGDPQLLERSIRLIAKIN